MRYPTKVFYLKRASFLLLCVALVAALPLADSILHSATAANVNRGPYLQSASQTGITIVWNTDQAFGCALRYGKHPESLDSEVSLGAGNVHVAVLTNLQPDTKYFYEIDVDGNLVFSGDDYWFRTYPPVGGTRPFSFLAWGDSGTGDASQSAVATQMDTLVPRPEFALGIGDLVYPAGEPANYNPHYFGPYRNLIRNMVIWPAMGNHDAGTASGQPYLDAFYCPTNTGASGNPSNTELYYSFDYGNSHFVCLDSQVTYGLGAAAQSAMLQWLADDLDAANTQGARWKFVYFHHPPYTKGTHDSDTEAQLIWMRTNLNPVMEARGVDMVLTGHSHVYERTYLLKNDAVLQGNAADYTKIATPDGCIYIVTGCGGKSGSGALNHPLAAFSKGNVTGSSVIDVSADVCRGYFIESNGQRIDLFSLSKAADTVSPFVRVVSATEFELELVFNEPVEAGAGGGGAENLGNYAISGGVTVTGATLRSDGRSVVLSTTAHAPSTAYSVAISNVRDRAGAPNTILSGSAVVYARGDVIGTATNLAPVAEFTTDIAVLNSGGSVNFNAAAAYDPDGTISSYEWSFGDGSSAANGISSSHTFSLPGVFLCSLTVTDNAGAQGVAHGLVYVHGAGNLPVASMTTSTTTISPGGTVSFNSIGSNDPDGGNIWLSWDFDDPASANLNHTDQSAPTHTFVQTGYYHVTLTVTDDEGSQAVATTTITVGSPPLSPTVDTPSLPGAVAGVPYAAELSASGGMPPYSWSVLSGALPTGLNFGSNGKFTGTPTTPGQSVFTVEVVDSTAQSNTRTYMLTTNPPPAKDSDDESCSTGEHGGLALLMLLLTACLVLSVRGVFASCSGCSSTQRLSGVHTQSSGQP